MVNGGAERVEVLTFLQEIGRDEDERIPRHPELLHQRSVHLPPHAADRLLAAEQGPKQPGGVADCQIARLGRIHIEDKVEVRGHLAQFVERAPGPRSEGGVVRCFSRVAR